MQGCGANPGGDKYYRTSAKKGRRAAPPPPSSASGSLETEDADLGLADDILMSPTSASSRPTTSASRKSVPAPKAESNHVRAVPSARPHRMTGWAEEGFHLGRRKSTASVLEEERFREADHIVKADSDEEEPVIPDLGDVQDEDFSQQVAQAPTVAVNRVATYKELDSDLFRHSAFATLDEIDLRALTKCMTSEAEVKE
ncbi:unnamed protein product, partial [Darwinula stevensoni]